MFLKEGKRQSVPAGGEEKVREKTKAEDVGCDRLFGKQSHVGSNGR